MVFLDIITSWKRCGFVYLSLLLEDFIGIDATSASSVSTVTLSPSVKPSTSEVIAKDQQPSL